MLRPHPSNLRRIAVAGAALAGLASFALAPAAAAADRGAATRGLVYTVENDSAHQGFLYCATSTPGPCTSEGHGQLFVFLDLNAPNVQATVDYKLVDGTAKVGVDFYGPSTGEEIFDGSDTTPQTTFIDVPVKITGATVAKTFTVKLTSASPAGDITSVGTETILPGNQTPPDCSMNLVSTESLALTCTGRPAGQQWHFEAECFHGFDDPTIAGNTVTGDGTSTVTCSSFFYHVGDTGEFATG
jgi:hypothetical protein